MKRDGKGREGCIQYMGRGNNDKGNKDEDEDRPEGGRKGDGKGKREEK